MASPISNPSSVDAVPVPEPLLMLRTRDTRLEGFMSDNELDDPFFPLAGVMYSVNLSSEMVRTDGFRMPFYVIGVEAMSPTDGRPYVDTQH